MKPPPGVEPGRPLYESGAAAVRGGQAGEPGLEPGLFWVRARRVVDPAPASILIPGPSQEVRCIQPELGNPRPNGAAAGTTVVL